MSCLCGNSHYTAMCGEISVEQERTRIVEDCTCSACLVALDALMERGFRTKPMWLSGGGLCRKKPKKRHDGSPEPRRVQTVFTRPVSVFLEMNWLKMEDIRPKPLTRLLRPCTYLVTERVKP